MLHVIQGWTWTVTCLDGATFHGRVYDDHLSNVLRKVGDISFDDVQSILISKMVVPQQSVAQTQTTLSKVFVARPQHAEGA